MKARSRLKPPFPQDLISVKNEQFKAKRSLVATVNKYALHSILLLISSPFVYGIFFLVTHYYPTQIENFLIPGTYLPLLFFLFMGALFIASFIFLKTRRGILTAISLVVIVFLKLQNSLSIFALLIIIFFVVSYEIVATLLEKS